MGVLFVCTVIPPWAFDASGVRAWANGVREAVAGAGLPPPVLLASMRASLCQAHAALLADIGVAFVPVADGLPHRPPPHDRRHTSDELRTVYGCPALMRIRLLEAAAAFDPAALVWFLGHDVVPAAADLRAASAAVSGRADLCVVAPLPTRRGADPHRPLVVNLDGATTTVVDAAVIQRGRGLSAGDLVEAVGVPTFDWALARASLFAAVPMRPGQVGVRHVWVAPRPGEKVVATGQASGGVLAGEAVGWFFGAEGAAGVRVMALMGALSSWREPPPRSAQAAPTATPPPAT